MSRACIWPQPRSVIAALLKRPVIEMFLTAVGLDPQPPPKGSMLRGNGSTLRSKPKATGKATD